MDNDQLLTEAQAAQIMQMEPSTLRKYRWKGYGPKYIKLGRSIRYRREDVLEYIDECKRYTASRIEQGISGQSGD